MHRVRTDSILDRRTRRNPRACGFSLIEILVVLVIIAVLAAAVSLAVTSAGGERVLTREAERFQALVGHACTQAELSGREIGVRVDAQGYAFSTLALDGWSVPEREGELRTRQWVAGMQLELERDGQLLSLTDSAEAAPQVVCFSSGELTPFALRLTLGDTTTRYVLRGDADGGVALEREQRR